LPFKFRKLEIKDVVLIEPHVFRDIRGYFMETYKFSEFSNNGIKEHFTQDNHSLSTKYVLRGLHYQLPPYAQGKLVRCINGEIFDVAVDIRKNSPTFGKWVGVNLSSENKKMLYIPSGFAHGFLTLSDVAEIHYKMTNEYAPEYERGILWNDKEIDINWPVDDINSIIISDKDKVHPFLKDAEIF
jgi:dTDP-4-dehydrorhamnose 3,5-epimerase